MRDEQEGSGNLEPGERPRPGSTPAYRRPDGAPAAWDQKTPADGPAGGGGFDEFDDRGERARRDAGAIRAEDTEPYVGLQYVARLFKIVAMVVIVALTAEIVAALAMEGPGALFPLFLEVLQGAVLAALLWGASDLTLLFIDVGHDVRAARVLLGRMSARMNADAAAKAGEGGGGQVRRGPRPGDTGTIADRGTGGATVSGGGTVVGGGAVGGGSLGGGTVSGGGSVGGGGPVGGGGSMGGGGTLGGGGNVGGGGVGGGGDFA
jgi:hypothetical protein